MEKLNWPIRKPHRPSKLTFLFELPALSVALVDSVTDFAESFFIEDVYSQIYQPFFIPLEKYFDVFKPLAIIDNFLRSEYLWLWSWPGNIFLAYVVCERYSVFYIYEQTMLKSAFLAFLSVSKQGEEGNYGIADVSLPVVQTTFSVYFLFELNLACDMATTTCRVNYFLESDDEIYMPNMEDPLSFEHIKNVIKSKLICFGTSCGIGRVVEPLVERPSEDYHELLGDLFKKDPKNKTVLDDKALKKRASEEKPLGKRILEDKMIIQLFGLEGKENVEELLEDIKDEILLYSESTTNL